MRYRVLLVAAALLTASASAYGQSKLAGKWQTDNVPAALEAQKNAPPAPEPGAKGGRGGGGGAPQAIMLDLQVDASGKISGTVTEIGNPPVLTIDTGTITGKTISWVTMPRGVIWNLEMTDEDTLTLTGRQIPGRGGAGAAKGTGPGPDAAPGGGGPPAGGGAPGGGRGGGRGPAAPIIFHRTK
jgi:hypothetical protein